METEYYFYVLLCQDETFYGGFTTNLANRLKAHNEGKGAKYTKSRRPVQMIHAESFLTKSEALKAEYAFKHQSRLKKEQYLEEKQEQNILKKQKLS